MSDLRKRLTALWEIEESEREKGIKLLTKVYSNILANPSDPKFRDLNFSKIRKKLDQCRPAFYLLFTAGFSQSVDGTRLQWPNNQITRKLIEKASKGLEDKIAGRELDGEDYGAIRDPSEREKEAEALHSSFGAHRPPSKEKKKAADGDRSQLERIMAKNKQMKAQRLAQRDKQNAAKAENEKAPMDTESEIDSEAKQSENAGDAENVDGDVAMADGSSSNSEAEKAKAESEAARLGLGADDMELLEQIKKSKGITHTLKASDLAGLSKEEKIEKFKETQELFRKEKKQNLVLQKLEKEKRRRAGVHAGQEAERKRKAYELKMVAQRKARKKADDKKRKARIKEKIEADKKRRREQKEREKAKKEAAAKVNAQQEE